MLIGRLRDFSGALLQVAAREAGKTAQRITWLKPYWDRAERVVHEFMPREELRADIRGREAPTRAETAGATKPTTGRIEMPREQSAKTVRVPVAKKPKVKRGQKHR
jgi:hypothetical protein